MGLKDNQNLVPEGLVRLIRKDLLILKSQREKEKSQNNVICKAHLPLLALKIEGEHEPRSAGAP